MILKVEGVSKQFGGLLALSGVSFDVKEGEILSLIGPNGAGKSTLMNVITGFDYPTNGTISYKNQNIIGKQPQDLVRMGMGRTYQIARLFKQMTVLENVMVGFFSKMSTNNLQGLLQTSKARKELKEVREKAYELLDFINMTDEAEQPASILPYGKIRLVEVARALAGEPQLLLLDEPACGLHPSEVKQFAMILRQIQKRGTTILMIEHDMKLVMDVSDRIVVLNNGTVLASGLPEEIKKNHEVISAYLGKGFSHVGT